MKIMKNETSSESQMAILKKPRISFPTDPRRCESMKIIFQILNLIYDIWAAAAAAARRLHYVAHLMLL